MNNNREWIWYIAMVIAVGLLFMVSLFGGIDMGRRQCEDRWRRVIIKIKRAKDPTFITLPNNDTILIRYYPDDYVFTWDEPWPKTKIMETKKPTILK